MPGTPRAAVRIEPYTESHGYSPNSGGFSPGSNASTDTDSHSVDSNPRSENELTRKTSGTFIPTRSISLLSGERKPAYNPMQFVKVGPANLYQEAQKQIKQAEEVKIARSGLRTWKDDEEDWQSNLSSWKTTRRKKVEHVIERVVEVKKYEEEAFDRDAASRRRKTFSEMMQERSEKGRRSRTSFDLSLYTSEEQEREDGGADDETGVFSDENEVGYRGRSSDHRSEEHTNGSNGHSSSNDEDEEKPKGSRVLYADASSEKYDGDGKSSSDDGQRDDDVVGASSAVAILSKSVNDLRVADFGDRSQQEDDSGFGSSLYKAPSTPHVWSSSSASASFNQSSVREEQRETSVDAEDDDEGSDGEKFDDSAHSSLDSHDQRPNTSSGHVQVPQSNGKSNGSAHPDDEWRRIQELENNLIQQLEREESERAKFAFGLVPPTELVIDTDLGMDDPSSLILSPSAMEPPKEKPPPPPPSEPPPLHEPEVTGPSKATTGRMLPERQELQEPKNFGMSSHWEPESVVRADGRQDNLPEPVPIQQQAPLHAPPPPPPPQKQEPLTASTTAALMETFQQKTFLRQTLSNSSSVNTTRSSSPPAVTIRPASGMSSSQGHMPAVRSTSVSNRVKMWETGNFPRKSPEEEAEEEEDDDEQDSDSKNDAVIRAQNTRNDYEREAAASGGNLRTQQPSTAVSATVSSRMDVPPVVPKESVRELYHNPAFAVRESPQPTQMSSSWNGDEEGKHGASNYYQNIAELRGGPQLGQDQPYGTGSMGMNGGMNAAASTSADPLPRAVSAAGFVPPGGNSRHVQPGQMHHSSQSDSSLRPRVDDGMWRGSNGNWNRQNGARPEETMPNGYQQQQPWNGEDPMSRALRSRSVEDLPHHPHHQNHHPHNPPLGSSVPAPGLLQQQHLLPQHKTLPALPHQLQQQARQQHQQQRMSGQYSVVSQRPSVQPPPPPSSSSSSSTISLASVPRARIPGRSDYAPHGHVVYQSQLDASQPIYENLPPPVRRSGPVVAPQPQPLDPVFHNSQMAAQRGVLAAPHQWQRQQAQPQQQSHPFAPSVGHGPEDPRMAGGAVGSGPPLLSVSGKKKCSHCGRELGRGAAMIVESLRLFYHLECFRCCVCEAPLGNGKTGADVRVRNNRLHCHNCYSNEQGVKFSKV